jgi:hypothetical protein
MSTYMNRCNQCGCTDETRIMRSEYDQMKSDLYGSNELLKKTLAWMSNVYELTKVMPYMLTETADYLRAKGLDTNELLKNEK